MNNFAIPLVSVVIALASLIYTHIKFRVEMRSKAGVTEVSILNAQIGLMDRTISTLKADLSDLKLQLMLCEERGKAAESINTNLNRELISALQKISEFSCYAVNCEVRERRARHDDKENL